MKVITIRSCKAREVIDITNDVNAALQHAGRETGMCHLFVRHTTAALTTVPLDPIKELDLLGMMEAIVNHPSSARHGSDRPITHHRSYMPPDILAAFVGSTIAIPISDRKLFLGKFQRVVLLELEGPSEREVVIA